MRGKKKTGERTISDSPVFPDCNRVMYTKKNTSPPCKIRSGVVYWSGRNRK